MVVSSLRAAAFRAGRGRRRPLAETIAIEARREKLMVRVAKRTHTILRNLESVTHGSVKNFPAAQTTAPAIPPSFRRGAARIDIQFAFGKYRTDG
ncbi:MAG: hypothetical protein JOY90_13850 [Bradyrhizobium sp.]|uniref:hypothetical protein n=1 Tax=Bradyrhizobium sp. TaxID=376 RepID=UPI001D9F1CDA|nr:hypothetical protein [Bradyrhizobium sp.]MBV9561512.1 hypothetical protein [Bradyrhizobium sp.]